MKIFIGVFWYEGEILKVSSPHTQLTSLNVLSTIMRVADSTVNSFDFLFFSLSHKRKKNFSVLTNRKILWEGILCFTKTV